MNKPFSEGGKLSFNKWLPLGLAVLAFLVTGCPHNVYEVDLKPAGSVIERKLAYHREEGVFDKEEAARIAGLYSTNSATADRKNHTATGTFSNAMPNDIGGAGEYTNATTLLGEAGLYVERFRGTDDLVALQERRNKAASKMADLFMGWAGAELSQTQGYDQLRKFLDTDFRRDLQNFGQYMLASGSLDLSGTNYDSEAFVRIGQYFHERGYFTVGQFAQIVKPWSDSDDRGMMQLVQRLVARKMGVPDNAPIPAALDLLSDGTKASKSFEKYLAGTDDYKALLKKWEAEKKSSTETNPPTPMDVAGEAMTELTEFDWGSTPDELTVRLSLSAPPVDSNGKWDEALHCVTWEAGLTDRGKTNAPHLPFLCYADWVKPNEDFQKAHIGRVGITNEALLEYTLWRGGLDPRRGTEWDSFLSNLKPGGAWWRTVDGFRFSGEPATVPTNAPSKPLASDYPRQLLQKAVE